MCEKLTQKCNAWTLSGNKVYVKLVVKCYIYFVKFN